MTIILQYLSLLGEVPKVPKILRVLRVIKLGKFELLIMIHLYEGRKIFYNDSGAGVPVVLLHGYLESSEVWNGFGEKMAKEFRVISVDLPGHGSSEIFGETHTMEFMADVLKDLLDSLRLHKVFLVGHSLGGYVTLAFLEYFPEYLIGYCLFHSQPFPDSPEALEKRVREIAIVKAGKKHLMYPDNVTRMFASSNLNKLSDALQRSKDIASEIQGDGIIAVLQGMMQRPSRLRQVEEGRVPFLWILGSMDSYIPCDTIQKKVKLPDNATVIVLQHSGHMGFIEEEDLSLKTISEFINRLSDFGPRSINHKDFYDKTNRSLKIISDWYPYPRLMTAHNL